MVGSTIKVVATAENGNTFESDETEEVGVYEALEILSAEQVKKDQVYVTFSAPISEADKITVTKGSADKTVSAVLPDDDNLGATIVMKDALSAGEYVVTLTPADEDEDPSSVTFEAITANKAERIEILGDYLVMKDTNFNEGYCFIKGYNHFDEEVILSGLTVNAAPSTSTQYDASTGKLTVKSAEANQYAIVKQVTVYAQAMVDSKALVDHKTLEVSSIGYPTEVEFGEITKDDTNAPDISEGITINELNSGLYYIPILSVKDNYGNDMLAKDLNYLDEKNLLTTVPTNDTSLYFKVRPEGSVFTEKNGQIVIFLDGGNGKPGTFNFLMTSAGGQFEKEVKIIENPFISTLDVTIPDIYEYEETEAFGLVGCDKDGHELDLYDYLQEGEYDAKLTFIDKQNLTESSTQIDAGAGNGKWRVQKFADTKTYKVTFVPNEQVKAKGIITFVTTTADFHTETKMATVGSRGTSGYIGSELKKAATVTYDFNQNLKFFDANGKEMDRAHNAKYPKFVTAGDTVKATLVPDQLAELTDEKIATANHDGDNKNDFAFYYVVSKDDKGGDGTTYESVTQNAGPKRNGEVTTADQYYVYLIANQAVDGVHNLDNTAKNRIIDSRSFYVSNKQDGDVPVSYTAKVNNKLYTGDQYDDDVEVKVTVTYRNGVKEEKAASGLALDGGFKVAGNKISKGTAKGDGTATVSVYLAEVKGETYVGKDGNPTNIYKNDGAVATCTLTYSDDDPVGTSVSFKREVQLANYGTSWKEDETEKVWDLADRAASQITVTDGELKMTNGNVAGDIYYMTVNDQYGTPMKNAKYYINGEQIPTANTQYVGNNEQKVLEIKGQSKGSEVSKTWRVNVPTTATVWAEDKSEPEPVGAASTDDPAKLVKILTAAATNGVADEITFTGIDAADAGTIVGADDTLVIASGATLNAANNVTVNGKLKNNGIMNYGGNALPVKDGTTFTNNGTISGVTTLGVGTNGVATATFKNTGKITLAGDTTVNGTVTNSGTFDAGTAHDIIVNADATFTNDSAVTCKDITVAAGGEFVNNANGTINCNDATGDGTFTNKGEVTATGTVNMFKHDSFHNFGTVDAAAISGYFYIESSSAETIADTYTATTVVPAGIKATITFDGASADPTLTIDNSDKYTDATVLVKDATDATIIDGDVTAANITGTSDGEAAQNVTVENASGQLYTIAYDANGGTGTVAAIEDVKASDTTGISDGTGITRSDYAFAGWALTASGDVEFTDSDDVATVVAAAVAADKVGAEGAIKLYAVWAPTYTVEYSANGGDGGMTGTSQTDVTADTLLSLPETTAAGSNTGKKCIGWATKNTGATSADVITSGSTVGSVIGSASAGGTITLYAVWVDAT